MINRCRQSARTGEGACYFCHINIQQVFITFVGHGIAVSNELTHNRWGGKVGDIRRLHQSNDRIEQRHNGRIVFEHGIVIGKILDRPQDIIVITFVHGHLTISQRLVADKACCNISSGDSIGRGIDDGATIDSVTANGPQVCNRRIIRDRLSEDCARINTTGLINRDRQSACTGEGARLFGYNRIEDHVVDVEGVGEGTACQSIVVYQIGIDALVGDCVGIGNDLSRYSGHSNIGSVRRFDDRNIAIDEDDFCRPIQEWIDVVREVCRRITLWAGAFCFCLVGDKGSRNVCCRQCIGSREEQALSYCQIRRIGVTIQVTTARNINWVRQRACAGKDTCELCNGDVEESDIAPVFNFIAVGDDVARTW